MLAGYDQGMVSGLGVAAEKVHAHGAEEADHMRLQQHAAREMQCTLAAWATCGFEKKVLGSATTLVKKHQAL